MNDNIIAYLIERLLKAAKESHDEMEKNKSDIFVQGRNLAYYEMLDMLKSGLDMYDVSLEDYGLDVDLEGTYA